MRFEKPGFFVDTDPEFLDLGVIHGYLARSTWSRGIPRECVERAVQGSLCFGLFSRDQGQVGFARVVTDRATFAYLCDVFVLEDFQRQGHGRWLTECVQGHPELQGLRRWLLATSTAPWLYEKLGWSALSKPAIMMERFFPNVYTKGNS